jgi:acetyl esterase
LVEDLSGLPSAYVLTAEYDPLCDEGEEYAHLLHEAAVPVTLRRFGGMIHGFIQLTAVAPVTRTAIDEVSDWLRTTLGSVTAKSVTPTAAT